MLLPCATIATANQIDCDGGNAECGACGDARCGAEARRAGARAGRCLRIRARARWCEVGDPTYAVDTPGFHMDNVAINTTAATSATAQGLVAYRTQEMDLESLYFLGNSEPDGHDAGRNRELHGRNISATISSADSRRR